MSDTNDTPPSAGDTVSCIPTDTWGALNPGADWAPAEDRAAAYAPRHATDYQPSALDASGDALCRGDGKPPHWGQAWLSTGHATDTGGTATPPVVDWRVSLADPGGSGFTARTAEAVASIEARLAGRSNLTAKRGAADDHHASTSCDDTDTDSA